MPKKRKQIVPPPRTAAPKFASLNVGGGQKLLKDLLALFSGQLLSMLIGFVTFAYLARVMAPESYGTIEFAIALTAFATIVIEGGVGIIGVREISRNRQQASKIAAQVVTARVLVGIVVIPLVGFSATFTGQTAAVQTMVWLFAISLIAIPFKQDWLLQGFERMGPVALAHPIRTLMLAAGILLFVRGDDDLILVGIAEVVSVFTVIIYVLAAQYVLTVKFDFRWRFVEALHFLAAGFSVGLSNMIWALMLYAPMVLLAVLVGGDDPAWLGAAQRIVISLMTMSAIYHFNIYPVIARSLHGNREVWLRLSQASIRLVAWVGFGGALVVTLLSPWLMPKIFGEPFSVSAPVLAVLIWAVPLRMLSDHARWSLIAVGRQGAVLIAETVGATVLVAVGVFLIPTYMAGGAALALVSGILAGGIVLFLQAEKFVGGMRIVRNIALPLLAASGATGVATLMADGAVHRTLFGSGLYVVIGVFAIRGLLTDFRILVNAKSAPN